MSAVAAPHPAGVHEHSVDLRKLVHMLWLANAMLVAFAVPWTTTRVALLDHRGVVVVDLVAATTFVALYVRTARPTPAVVRVWFVRSLALGAVVGALTSIGMVVLLAETVRPSGFDLVVAVAGRGVLQGIATTALTVGVPVAVAHELVVGVPHAVRGVARVVLTAVFVWAVATVHLLGYAQYDAVDLGPARATAMVTASPAVLTGHPAGAVVANVAVRVTVTLHAFEEDAIVPPRLEVVRSYQPPGLFPPELRPMGDLVIG